MNTCKELTRVLAAGVLDGGRLLWVYVSSSGLAVYECNIVKANVSSVARVYRGVGCKPRLAGAGSEELCRRVLSLYTESLERIGRELGVEGCRAACRDRAACIDELARCIWSRAVDETNRLAKSIADLVVVAGVPSGGRRGLYEEWVLDLGMVTLEACAPVVGMVSIDRYFRYVLLGVERVRLEANVRLIARYYRGAGKPSLHLEARDLRVGGKPVSADDAMLLGLVETNGGVYKTLIQGSRRNPLYPGSWASDPAEPSSSISAVCIARWLYDKLIRGM